MMRCSALTCCRLGCQGGQQIRSCGGSSASEGCIVGGRGWERSDGTNDLQPEQQIMALGQACLLAVAQNCLWHEAVTVFEQITGLLFWFRRV